MSGIVKKNYFHRYLANVYVNFLFHVYIYGLFKVYKETEWHAFRQWTTKLLLWKRISLFQSAHYARHYSPRQVQHPRTSTFYRTSFLQLLQHYHKVAHLLWPTGARYYKRAFLHKTSMHHSFLLLIKQNF